MRTYRIGCIGCAALGLWLLLVATAGCGASGDDDEGGGSSGCREFGESCESDADCCSDMPCIEGECI